ncbi:hypothetical protein B1J92_L09372g [Nakaseomyces glabratus]|nr:hypothetical protein B1J91_L09372g [Nakaseomyces glabratus]OXB46432.1 hypothetical protein B1J92_L09372g [Nakaseomyces glabratus]
MMEGQNISARNSSATAIYYGKIEDKGSKKKQNESFSFLDLEPVGPYFHFTHRSRWRRRGREGGSFKKTHNTHTHTQKRKKLMKRTPFCTVKSVPHVRENTRT